MWNVPKMVKTLDSVLWQTSPGKSSLDVAALGCPPSLLELFCSLAELAKGTAVCPGFSSCAEPRSMAFGGRHCHQCHAAWLGTQQAGGPALPAPLGRGTLASKKQSQNAQVFAEHSLSWSPQLSSFKKGGQAGRVLYLKLSLLLL